MLLRVNELLQSIAWRKGAIMVWIDGRSLGTTRTTLKLRNTHRLGRRAQRALTKPVDTRPNGRATEVLLAEPSL